MNRIEVTEIQSREAALDATEAKEVLHALQTLMNRAGVSDSWTEPEQTGVNAAFGVIVTQLTTDFNQSRKATDMAARDLIDFYLDDEG